MNIAYEVSFNYVDIPLIDLIKCKRMFELFDEIKRVYENPEWETNLRRLIERYGDTMSIGIFMPQLKVTREK